LSVGFKLLGSVAVVVVLVVKAGYFGQALVVDGENTASLVVGLFVVVVPLNFTCLCPQ